MGIKSDFSNAEFDARQKEFEEALDERILASMSYAGEEFVKDSRTQVGDHELGFYEDQTGNLRNSIAYYIYRFGELVKKDERGNTENNLKLISPLVQSKNYQLIGIAGMNYASYVEAKGYNVISQQKDVCIINLGVYLQDVKKFAEHEL